MSLKEKAGFYYYTMDKGCAEAILLAANDVYSLGMTEAETGLFAGFLKKRGHDLGGQILALTGGGNGDAFEG